MHVSRLSLTDFRNYKSASISLAPGVSLFLGRNGQGKTNIVESVAYLATLSSHRVSGDEALVRRGEESAIVRAVVSHEDREILVELQINSRGVNQVKVNQSKTKPRELPRFIKSVVFAPEDLLLVRGEPAARRKMIDDLLTQLFPRLAGVFVDYERTLRQRNTLLKSARANTRREIDLNTLEVWDEKLINLGSEIIWNRLVLIEKLRNPLASAYLSIVGANHFPDLNAVLSIDQIIENKSITLNDHSNEKPVLGEIKKNIDIPKSPPAITEIVKRFTEALISERSKELDRGVTLVGPHRDDVLFTLNAMPAKGYASHGESWSFALSLRLAGAEIIRSESTTGDPIIILDDVFAELDKGRRDLLAAAIETYEQVLITAAVKKDVPEFLNGALFKVDAGTVIQEPNIDIKINSSESNSSND